MEEQFMLLEELIREEREDARKQALAEGRELGLSEGMAQERVAAILEVLAGAGGYSG